MQKRHYTTKGVKKMYHCGKNSFLAQMEKSRNNIKNNKTATTTTTATTATTMQTSLFLAMFGRRKAFLQDGE